jgi:hypothetical protein
LQSFINKDAMIRSLFAAATFAVCVAPAVAAPGEPSTGRAPAAQSATAAPARRGDIPEPPLLILAVVGVGLLALMVRAGRARD